MPASRTTTSILAGSGTPVRRAHRPDAVAAVVREEQGVVEARRVRAALVERQPRDDRAVERRAAIAREHRAAVRIREARLADRRGRVVVQVVAQRQAGVVRALDVALVARPAEVLDRSRPRVRQPVDLLGVVPADVADPELVRAGPERDPERVAEAGGDDPSGERVRVSRERIAGRGGARGGIDSDDRPVERDRLAGRPAQRLAPERAAASRRLRVRDAQATGRIAARVGGRGTVHAAAELPPVGHRRTTRRRRRRHTGSRRRRTRGRRSSGSGTACTSPRRAPARAQSCHSSS